MDKVIKIILSILAALLLFLLGVVFGGREKREKVSKDVKKAISDVNKQHKKALAALRDECEEKLKKKNEIISDLKKTIECLKIHLESVEEPGVARLVKNLNDNQEMLNKL